MSQLPMLDLFCLVFYCVCILFFFVCTNFYRYRALLFEINMMMMVVMMVVLIVKQATAEELNIRRGVRRIGKTFS